jgi:predicted dehydrogenase
MNRIRIARVGTGFTGRVHTEATRRLGKIDVVGIAGSTLERARAFADRAGVEWATADYREFLADPGLAAVHVLTPNDLNFPMAKAPIEAGKHVVREKPLATSIALGKELVALTKQTGLANCTFHNIRAHPQAQDGRTNCGSAKRNSSNQVVNKDPSLLRGEASTFADLPGGHSGGYDDTFKQTLRRFYRTVADRRAPVEYPVFEDGLRQLKILQAVLESAQSHARVVVRE